MESESYKTNLKEQLIDAHGRIEYTYTQHHIIARRLQKRHNFFKVVEIVLTAVSTVGFLATVIQD